MYDSAYLAFELTNEGATTLYLASNISYVINKVSVMKATNDEHNVNSTVLAFSNMLDVTTDNSKTMYI